MGTFSIPAIAAASAVAGLAGAGTSAVGAIESGQATAANANYQSQVAANNAIIAGQNAERATQAGAANATAESLRGRETVGKAIAGAAASGVDPNTGSAADVVQTDREMNVLDTANVVNDAATQAWGYRTQGTGFTAQSQLDAAEASQAPLAGDLSGGSDLLSGAASVGSKWVGFQQQNGSQTPATALANGTAPV